MTSKSGLQSNSKAKPGLHSRNQHRFGYNFDALVDASGSLKAYVRDNGYGQQSIDFANPEAVVELNKALLKQYYSVKNWHIPADNLCPPVPGRADYLHHLADLLAEDSGKGYPVGQSIQILDVGVGANCIYPLIGQSEYGWKFIGSDIDKASLDNAQKVIESNPGMQHQIELRHQNRKQHVFENIIQTGDYIDLTLCNPPFHDSAATAAAGSIRKQTNLSKKVIEHPQLNFGGKHTELWCEGGELAFIKKMIVESQSYRNQVYFFTSLVSRKANIPLLLKALKKSGVDMHRVVDMQQGNKQSRFIAWTFLTRQQRSDWRKNKWKTQIINQAPGSKPHCN